MPTGATTGAGWLVFAGDQWGCVGVALPCCVPWRFDLRNGWGDAALGTSSTSLDDTTSTLTPRSKSNSQPVAHHHHGHAIIYIEYPCPSPLFLSFPLLLDLLPRDLSFSRCHHFHPGLVIIVTVLSPFISSLCLTLSLSFSPFLEAPYTPARHVHHAADTNV